MYSFSDELACKNLLVDNGRPPSKTVTVDLTVNRLSDIPVISIIDDDELVRDAVKSLVRSLGYTAAEHASAEDYLRSNEHGTSSCLITDIQMPGMSGADLQTQLIAEGFTPIIFMTAFDNEKIRVEQKGEVKDASMLGAAEARPRTARLIGILPAKPPNDSVCWKRAKSGRWLFLHSGQPHYVRNIINGRTPDVLVAFGGSSGTLAEIVFAKTGGRPLLFFPGSLKRLKRNFRENLRQEPNASDNLKTYFTLPLEAYPEAGVPNDSSQLISILEEVLFSAKEKEVESSHPS